MKRRKRLAFWINEATKGERRMISGSEKAGGESFEGTPFLTLLNNSKYTSHICLTRLKKYIDMASSSMIGFSVFDLLVLF